MIRVELGISPGHSTNETISTYHRWVVRSHRPVTTTFPIEDTGDLCAETGVKDKPFSTTEKTHPRISDDGT